MAAGERCRREGVSATESTTPVVVFRPHAPITPIRFAPTPLADPPTRFSPHALTPKRPNADPPTRLRPGPPTHFSNNTFP
jgi:hypothetical protein